MKQEERYQKILDEIKHEEDVIRKSESEKEIIESKMSSVIEKHKKSTNIIERIKYKIEHRELLRDYLSYENNIEKRKIEIAKKILQLDKINKVIDNDEYSYTLNQLKISQSILTSKIEQEVSKAEIELSNLKLELLSSEKRHGLISDEEYSDKAKKLYSSIEAEKEYYEESISQEYKYKTEKIKSYFYRQAKLGNISNEELREKCSRLAKLSELDDEHNKILNQIEKEERRENKIPEKIKANVDDVINDLNDIYEKYFFDNLEKDYQDIEKNTDSLKKLESDIYEISKNESEREQMLDYFSNKLYEMLVKDVTYKNIYNQIDFIDKIICSNTFEPPLLNVMRGIQKKIVSFAINEAKKDFDNNLLSEDYFDKINIKLDGEIKIIDINEKIDELLIAKRKNNNKIDVMLDYYRAQKKYTYYDISEKIGRPKVGEHPSQSYKLFKTQKQITISEISKIFNYLDFLDNKISPEEYMNNDTQFDQQIINMLKKESGTLQDYSSIEDRYSKSPNPERYLEYDSEYRSEDYLSNIRKKVASR